MAVWVRNAQLCLFTIPVAFLGTRVVEDTHIKEDGTPLRSQRLRRLNLGARQSRPLCPERRLTSAQPNSRSLTYHSADGFDTVVWAAIFTNAVGGMLVATVMKFAGNILRNFAQACAIIVGGLGSWLLFGFQITMPFVVQPRAQTFPRLWPPPAPQHSANAAWRGRATLHNRPDGSCRGWLGGEGGR